MRFLRIRTALAIAAFAAAGTAMQAQTVVVNPAVVGDLQAQIDTFRTGGANFGNPAPNVVQIDATAVYAAPGGLGFIDAEVIIRDTATVKYEPMTIEGINGRINLRVRNTSNVAPANNDALEIETDANLTFRNIIFCPSTTNIAAIEDMVQIRGQFSAVAPPAGPGTAVTEHTFDDCIFTGRNASGAPVVTDISQVYTNNTASIVDGAGTALINQSALDLASKRDQVVRLVLTDTIFSHYSAAGNLRTGLEENLGFDQASPNRGHSAAYPVALGSEGVTIDNCVFTYVGRRHINFFAAGGPAAARTQYTISNSTFYASRGHAILSAVGVADAGSVTGRAILELTNTNIWGMEENSNQGRCLSLDSDVFIKELDNCKLIAGNASAAIVSGSDAGDPLDNGTWDNSTLIAGAGAFFGVGTGDASTQLYTVTGCIIADRGISGVPAQALGGTGCRFDLVNCGLPTTGPYAVNTTNPLLQTSTNVIDRDPVFLNAISTPGAISEAGGWSTGAPTAAELGGQWWAVRNGGLLPEGYADAGVGATPLVGDSVFIGDARTQLFTALGGGPVTLFPNTSAEATAGTVPYEVTMLEIAADPATVGAGLPAGDYNDTKYWDVRVWGAGPTVPVGNQISLTLNWPDSIPAIATGSLYRFQNPGPQWFGVSGPASNDTSGDPNTTTHTGVSTFGLFAVGEDTCAYDVTPLTFAIFPDVGNVGNAVTIAADPGCPWSVDMASVPTWVTNVSPIAGVGPAVLTFDVAANAGNVRGGFFNILGGALTFPITVKQNGPETVLIVDSAFPPDEDNDFDTDYRTIQAAFDAIEPGGWFFGAGALPIFTVLLDPFVTEADVHDQGNTQLTLGSATNFTNSTTINIRPNGAPGSRAVVALGFPAAGAAGFQINRLASAADLNLNVQDITFMPSIVGRVAGDHVGGNAYASNNGDAISATSAAGGTGTSYNFDRVIICAADATGGGKGVPASTNGLQPYDPSTDVRFGDDLLWTGSAHVTAEQVFWNFTDCVFTQARDEGLLAYASGVNVNKTVGDASPTFSYNGGRAIQVRIRGTAGLTVTGPSPATPLRLLDNNNANPNNINTGVVTIVGGGSAVNSGSNQGPVTMNLCSFESTVVAAPTKVEIDHLDTAQTANNLSLNGVNFTGNAGTTVAISTPRADVIDSVSINGYTTAGIRTISNTTTTLQNERLNVSNTSINAAGVGIDLRSAGLLEGGISSVTITNCATAGIRIFTNTTTFAALPPAISNTRLVGNGVNFINLSDDVTALNITTTTFALPLTTNIQLGASGDASAQPVNITDCVLAGNPGIGDTGIDTTFKGSVAANVTFTAITNGGSAEAHDFVVKGSLATLGAGVIHKRPNFTSTSGPGFLEVNNCDFATADSASGPLVGGGTYTGACIANDGTEDSDFDGFSTAYENLVGADPNDGGGFDLNTQAPPRTQVDLSAVAAITPLVGDLVAPAGTRDQADIDAVAAQVANGPFAPLADVAPPFGTLTVEDVTALGNFVTGQSNFVR